MFAVFGTKDKTRSKWCGQIVYKVSEICHGHQDRIKVKSVEGSVGTEQLNSFKNDRQLQAIRKHSSKMLTVRLPTVHASVSTRYQQWGGDGVPGKGSQSRGWGGLVPVQWSPMHHGYWSHGTPITHMTENITFPQLRWRAVITQSWYSIVLTDKVVYM